MGETDELIDGIVRSARIPSGKRRWEIQQELRAHIEDFILAAGESGRDRNEIEKLVIAHFGDPNQIASGFSWVYRNERRRRRALTFTISTALLAISLVVAILVAQSGLAFGFGRPVLETLISRHTLIEALDILASVAAYLGTISLEKLFTAKPFRSAATVVTLIGIILIASFAAAGVHLAPLIFGVINGLFCRAIQLFMTREIARVSVIVVCFPLAGLALALERSSLSEVALLATSLSWLLMGIGYWLMTHLAARVDAAILNGFERPQMKFPKGAIK